MPESRSTECSGIGNNTVRGLEFLEGFPISYLKRRDSASTGTTRGLEILEVGNISGFTVQRIAAVSLSPSLRTRDRWNMTRVEMPRYLFPVKEGCSPNAINQFPIKEGTTPPRWRHFLNKISCAQYPTDYGM